MSDVLELAKKRFATAIEAEAENREKELDDLRFLAASPDDNWQWPAEVLQRRRDADQEGGIRPCLTINKLPQHHRQVTNEQRMNRPQIRVQPVDDQGDPEVAEIYNGIIRHIQVASEADLAYDTACDAQVAGGVGYFRILTEYCDERSFDQDIVIAPIADRFKVYMDPLGVLQHPAGRKCAWAFVIEDLAKEEYEAAYGKEFPVDWAEAGMGDQSQWFPNKQTVRVAEYFEIEQKPAKLLLWANGATSIEGEQMPAGVFVGEVPVKERKTSIQVCKWRKMTGQKVLSEKEMPTKYIPIIRVVGNQWIVEGKPVVSGLVRNAKDAQRMYNYNASMEVEMNALAPKAPFVGIAEQFDGHEDQWRKANVVPYAFLKYNLIVDEATGQIVPMGAPQRAQPAMPQAAIIAAKLAAGDDIKATTGQYDPSLGARSNETSGKAINARKIESDIGTFHYIDNLARAIRYGGTIIVDMIPKVYDTKRIARILGEDGTPDHVRVDPSIAGPYREVVDEATQRKLGKVYNLGVGKYDVVVAVGPSFTTKRQEAAEAMSGALERNPNLWGVIGDLAIKNMDWPGAEEMAKRLKVTLVPQVQQLLQEDEDEEEIPVQVRAAVQQLQAQLAAAAQAAEAATQAIAERDQKVMELQGQLKGRNVDAMAKMYEANKKAETELVKSRADVEVAKVNAAAQLAQAPQNADLMALVARLDQVLASYDEKLNALAASTAVIANQLRDFEIAASMPQVQAA